MTSLRVDSYCWVAFFLCVAFLSLLSVVSPPYSFPRVVSSLPREISLVLCGVSSLLHFLLWVVFSLLRGAFSLLRGVFSLLRSAFSLPPISPWVVSFLLRVAFTPLSSRVPLSPPRCVVRSSFSFVALSGLMTVKTRFAQIQPRAVFCCSRY